MLFRLAFFLDLAFVGSASHDIKGVVNSTAQVISALKEKGSFAKKRFNASKFDQQLDKIGQHVEADFDADLYAKKKKAFAELAQRASEKAKESSSSTNASVAEELSKEAEAALGNMTKVGSELDAMEEDLRNDLQGALGAKLNPEVALDKDVSKNASHLQKKAHSMMDPLYGWGDSAEDQADRLNDQTNNALSAVGKVVRTYRRHIVHHSREVRRGVEHKLLASQDRTATWRRVNRDVSDASRHVESLQLDEAKEASDSSASPKSNSADNVKDAAELSAPESVSTSDGTTMTCTDAVKIWSLAKGCGHTRCHDRSSESECMSDTVISGKHCCHWEQANTKGLLGFSALSSKSQRQTASNTWAFLAACVPAAGLTILLGAGLFRSRAPKEKEDFAGYYYLSA